MKSGGGVRRTRIQRLQPKNAEVRYRHAARYASRVKRVQPITASFGVHQHVLPVPVLAYATFTRAWSNRVVRVAFSVWCVASACGVSGVRQWWC